MPLCGFEDGLDDPEPVLAGDPVGQGDRGRPGAGVDFDYPTTIRCVDAGPAFSGPSAAEVFRVVPELGGATTEVPGVGQTGQAFPGRRDVD